MSHIESVSSLPTGVIAEQTPVPANESVREEVLQAEPHLPLRTGQQQFVTKSGTPVTVQHTGGIYEESRGSHHQLFDHLFLDSKALGRLIDDGASHISRRPSAIVFNLQEHPAATIPQQTASKAYKLKSGVAVITLPYTHSRDDCHPFSPEEIVDHLNMLICSILYQGIMFPRKIRERLDSGEYPRVLKHSPVA